MEKDSGTVFRELKEDVSAYVELKLELLKLSTYERTGKVIAVLSYGLILLFLAFFAILFIFLALGFFLGDWLGSSGFGFGIVAVSNGYSVSSTSKPSGICANGPERTW